MKYYKVNLLNKVKKHLKNGGIIAYPTESCYGFGCDPFNVKALRKLIRLKSRSPSKGMICVASSISQAQLLVNHLSSDDLTELKQYWPGFYTMVLDSRPNVPQLLRGKHHKIAVRVSSHQMVKQLCQFLRGALVSTSANISGHKSIRDYRQCKRQFGNKILVLPGVIGGAKRPSTIIDFATKKVLR